ncbi:MAG: carbamoyltransferase C-terminal domain-containing protein [Bacteroidota bacterium]
MYILGINAYHGDSSACIYKDGVLVAATEEERLRRVKHWAGIPSKAVEFCLQAANITLAEVDHITVSKNPKAKFNEKVLYTIKKGSILSVLNRKRKEHANVQTLKEDLAALLDYDVNDLKAEMQYVEHHRSHMASSFFVSPFEESAILSVDGMGDFTSTMRGTGKGNKMEVIDSVSFPSSVGYFYTMATQFLGFPHYGDEYKVMGLSPYGTPDENIMKNLRKVIKIKSDGLFELNTHYMQGANKGDWTSTVDGVPLIARKFGDEYIKLFGPARQKGDELTQYHKDFAASVQRVTEEVIFHMAEDLHRRTGLKNLCITGGVAQNSVANGKITDNTSFEQLYVPPAGHDGGTSVGSALFFYHQTLGHPRQEFVHQAYTGISFTNEQIEQFLQSKGINYKRVEDDAIYDMVTDSLVNGGVIGWFQGKAEFGPRALGNRSILVDPRRADARHLLNEKIKRRESFRPFAPSILKEHTAEYFEKIDEVPYMEKVFKIKPEKHDVIPAVTHVDGTGRLQTVDQADAPRYYSLISKFAEKTGVPVLLNTSFNENEPIVNTPEDALNCFTRTKMDTLVLENCVVSRN